MSDDDLKPRVEYVGRDKAEAIRAHIKALGERQQRQELAVRKMEVDYQHEAAPEEIWVFVKEHERLRESDPPRFSAETTDELLGIGRISTPRPSSSPKMALADLRLELAKAWAGAKICKTYEEARSRACKAVLSQALIRGVA